jgi:hypothetical protein
LFLEISIMGMIFIFFHIYFLPHLYRVLDKLPSWIPFDASS